MTNATQQTPDFFHQQLARFNLSRVAVAVPDSQWQEALQTKMDFRLAEGHFMVDGFDPFLAELLPLLSAAGCRWEYEEIDPDIFGEELERPVYAHAERIAAVGLIATPQS